MFLYTQSVPQYFPEDGSVIKREMLRELQQLLYRTFRWIVDLMNAAAFNLCQLFPYGSLRGKKSLGKDAVVQRTIGSLTHYPAP
jgi:hypothetical protein